MSEIKPSQQFKDKPPRSHQLKYENYRVQVSDGAQLHIRRIYNPEALKRLQDLTLPADTLSMPLPRPRSAVFFHGFAESGEIYYNDKGRGLAPYLAHQAYNCFVVDWRGKGRSWPLVSKHSDFALLDIVSKDIPAVWAFLSRQTNIDESICITHGFGSALVMAAVARHQSWIKNVSALIHFAPYRQLYLDVPNTSLKQKFALSLLSSRLSQKLVSTLGYFPADKLGFGKGAEAAKVYLDKLQWIQQASWIDVEDSYDYCSALETDIDLPPSLYLAAASDSAWGSPVVVKSFMRALGPHDGRLLTPAQKGDCATADESNYSSVGLLSDAKASAQSFARVVDWLNTYALTSLLESKSKQEAEKLPV